MTALGASWRGLRAAFLVGDASTTLLLAPGWLRDLREPLRDAVRAVLMSRLDVRVPEACNLPNRQGVTRSVPVPAGEPERFRGRRQEPHHLHHLSAGLAFDAATEFVFDMDADDLVHGRLRLEPQGLGTAGVEVARPARHDPGNGGVRFVSDETDGSVPSDAPQRFDLLADGGG